MNPETLTAQIRRGESDAVATALHMGPAAIATLLQLAADPDPDTRLGAMTCLDALGGPEAQAAALSALTDSDAQVASRAAMLLHNHPPEGKGPDLFTAFTRVRDDEVRPLIALAAGRVRGISPAPWVGAIATTQAANVADALLVATARMGHGASREAVNTRLATIPAEQAHDWVDHARYMDDPWVIRGLRPLLSRTEIVFSLSPDARPVPIRVCDLAAAAILDLSGKKSIVKSGVRPYTPSDLERVRQVAETA